MRMINLENKKLIEAMRSELNKMGKEPTLRYGTVKQSGRNRKSYETTRMRKER